MDHFELIEKLREKANVSYEDAKRALEQTNWDLLDAMVLLENEGRVQPQEKTPYTTRREPRPQTAQTDDSVRGVVRRLVDMLVSLVNRASKIDVVVSRHGKTVLTLPLIAVILLIVFTTWVAIVAIVVSLFFGIRYSLTGEGISDKVNQAMDRVANAADNIRGGGKNGGQPE